MACPIASQHIIAGDDHVNFFCACFHGLLNLPNALWQRSLSRRKTCRNRGNWNSRALKRVNCIRDTVGVHAHRTNGDPLAVQSKFFQHIGAERLFGFGAQTMNAPRRIVAREGGQVNAGDGA